MPAARPESTDECRVKQDRESSRLGRRAPIIASFPSGRERRSGAGFMLFSARERDKPEWDRYDF